MKKYLTWLVVSVMAAGFFGGLVFALSNSFQINVEKLLPSRDGKDGVLGSFDQEYDLSYAIEGTDKALEEEIEILTKRATYLLFGDFNNINESSESFYKRKQDWYDLRYAPEVPKDENGLLGLDTSSQEYQDDLVSGMAIPQIFSQANEVGLIYNSYGDIRVIPGDNIVISTIVLPKVKIKVQSKSDPMKYEYEETDFVMHYYFKKLNGEWKLYYLYGESTEDVEEYFGEIENTGVKGMMAMAPVYESKISTIYSFDKVKNLSQTDLNKVYDSNAPKVIYLDGYYNNAVVGSANGFYIADGLIVTTWSFLENALNNAQYVIARNYNSEPLEIEGIVTVNPETDVAVIKVANSNGGVKLGSSEGMVAEDPVIVLSSKTGVGVLVQTGIVIANDGYIQTSVPLAESDEGSPLLNQNGEVIGMNTARSVNSSISIAVGSGALREVQEKFGGLKHEEVKTVSFSELKENYYRKYDNEVASRSIPEKVWKKYAQVGKIDETIKLELVKANYKDGIVSLRYRNGISRFINSMQLAGGFREELEREGYEEVMVSDTKAVYENKSFQIIIMDEFDYLIVLMVRL